MASRIFVAIAAALILGGCGSGSSREETGHAGHQHPLLTPPCVGTGCTAPNPGLAPPAPPVIATKPLGPVDPPPVPLPPLPVAGVTLKRSSSSSLRLGATPGSNAATTPPPGCSNWSVRMQVLIISTDGKEADLGAIQQALGYHTIQYATWIATQNPGALTADKLATGCAGNYQGVILTTGSLSYSPDGGVTWKSALTSAEWMTLRTYEANFHVREISWYVYPGADQGLNPPSSGVDTTTSPIDATLTAAGQAVFPYVNAANPITITNAWTYRATPSDPNVTSLLVDNQNDALVSKRLTSDGRETMALTFDSNPYLIHDLVLQHGLVEWVTKGAYLGEFRSYLQPQVDDLFIDDDMYNASAYTGGVFRISPDDFNKSHDWWMAQQAQPGNADFRVLLAFNGEGSTPGDPLTTALKNSWGDYFFCSHTFTHLNLDAVDYNTAYGEFANNNNFARQLGIPDYSTQSLVNPDVSGLTNAAALSAAYDNGIRFMISDTSKESGKGAPPGWPHPGPNIGIYSSLQANLLFVPRHPTNLFYNVSTPDEWTAEYNAIYQSFWGRALSYQEVIDKESQNLLVYMLQGDLDPHMYHQPNLRAYDGTHSLLGDLLDMAFAKFRKYSTLPIKSLRLEDIGSRMADTMGRNWSGVTGQILNGTSAQFTSPNEVWFNASGVCNATAERYAGKCISSLYLPSGGCLTLPLQ